MYIYIFDIFNLICKLWLFLEVEMENLIDSDVYIWILKRLWKVFKYLI